MMATAHRELVEEPKPSFQVLERTFSILELFDQEHPEWSTTEVARRLGLPIPTVHRILAALRRTIGTRDKVTFSAAVPTAVPRAVHQPRVQWMPPAAAVTTCQAPLSCCTLSPGRAAAAFSR